MKPKICYTAAGILIHDDRVLLVKHKKLGIWLNPGGHTEDDELPHQTAEREYLEETGIKVQAHDVHGVLDQTDESEFFPSPIITNLHWVCRENFIARQQDPEHFQPAAPWRRGCEQHLGFLYLVRPVAGLEFIQNNEETDGIGWFTTKEVSQLETEENIKAEVALAFELLSAHRPE